MVENRRFLSGRSGWSPCGQTAPTRQRACGYSVVWGKGPHDWRGVKIHMGFNQEAYDAECVAIVRALEQAAERQNRWRPLEKVTIFTDAQEAITRARWVRGSNMPYKNARPWLLP